MGSGSSRMDQRKLRHQHRRRRRVGLAALICGGCGGDAASASSDDAAQMRGKLEEKSVNQVKFDDSAKASSLQMPVNESSPNYSQKPSSTTEGIRSGQRDNDASKCSVESCLEMFRSERNPALASTSRKPVEHMDTSFTSRAIDNCSYGNGNQNSTNFSSSIQQFELGDSHENLVNHSNDVVSIPSANRDLVSVIPSLSSTVHVPSEEPLVLTTASLNVATSTEPYEHRNGSVLHVDTVNISSDVLEGSGEITNSEPRRDTRRRFWNAISRHNSRRTVDSASLLTSAETNGLGYRDRWLLDFADRSFGEEAEDDSTYLRRRRRRHGLDGLSWRSRSETRQQIHAGSAEGENGHESSCPSSLHQDGTCSCTLLMTEVSSTRASIARIFVLAEALFEVLDEIQRQPGSLSFSVVSVPASESIVNIFPSKIHKKVDATLSNDDAEQCYICLADYEDGDKIRILPCHHEYHMCCVDKWLKEIHGVCPLCRRDVSEAAPVS